MIVEIQSSLQHLRYTVILRSLLHSNVSFSLTVHFALIFQLDRARTNKLKLPSYSCSVSVPFNVQNIESGLSSEDEQFTSTSSPSSLTTSGGSSVIRDWQVSSPPAGRSNCKVFSTSRQRYLVSLHVQHPLLKVRFLLSLLLVLRILSHSNVNRVWRTRLK